MRTKTILVIFFLACGLAAENLEKTQKKELEAQVKTMTGEAQRLERRRTVGGGAHQVRGIPGAH